MLTWAEAHLAWGLRRGRGRRACRARAPPFVPFGLLPRGCSDRARTAGVRPALFSEFPGLRLPWKVWAVKPPPETLADPRVRRGGVARAQTWGRGVCRSGQWPRHLRGDSRRPFPVD